MFSSSMEEKPSNLIVNYLPQMLTDAEFKNLFMSVGHVKACKIIRHKATGYSYGFGFVEYTNPADAVRAIETLNGFNLQNKKIKVAFSRPGGTTIKNANLYICNIPRHLTEEQLHEIFSKFGDIIQCRLLKEATGNRNKGVGFVLYDKRCQAEEAIKKLNGQVLEGSTDPLSVKFAEDNAKKIRVQMNHNMAQAGVSPFGTPIGGRFAAGGPVRQTFQGRYRYNPMTNGMGPMGGYSCPPTALTVGGDGHILFVYNIGPDTDEKTLWQVFARYGTVQKVNVIREGATGSGKGYGFVSMVNYEEAVMAIESLNGFNLFGKPLQVSFKTPKQS